jgi:transposase-like protein
MVLKTDQRGRVRVPAERREELLDLFEQSGMSGAAFARVHGLRYSTFAHWRKVRRERSACEDPDRVTFQEVNLHTHPGPSASGVLVELPLGARVRLERADQIPWVAALCQQLKEAAQC